MKQQQAGIIEAKVAIKRADVSVLQGRSIIVFTVFTIFFLPLSFFASIFGMNTAELNGGLMPLAKQLTYMFSLSGALILFSLSVAFSAWVRAVIAVPSGLIKSYLTYWMGLHDVVTTNIKALRDFETKKKDQLKDRYLKEQMVKIEEMIQKAKADGEKSGNLHVV
ncbi:hypothetical protein CDD83_9912 [Cordyceps sp. RAO-2017]|nr:hypothetical protein CDD83_9912 [Cordyceps sp. RAO-2017]